MTEGSANQAKRKQKRSLFSFETPNKRTRVDSGEISALNLSNTNQGLVSSTDSQAEKSMRRKTSRLRLKGSKLWSVLRWSRRSSNAGPSEPPIETPLSAALDRTNIDTRHSQSHMTANQPGLRAEDNQLPVFLKALNVEPSAPLISHSREQRKSIRKSHSSPGLSRRLSHKLSTALIHPTIVHRPDMKSRPSVHSIRSDAEHTFLTSGRENAPDSSAPSSPQTSGSGNTGPQSKQSTGKTSVSSSSCPATLSPNKDTTHGSLTKSKSTSLLQNSKCQMPLTPIAEVETITFPSIRTVETTATAKIFFETFFNSLYSKNPGARTLRKQALIQQLKGSNLSPETQSEEWTKWQENESKHLRRLRVMKTEAVRRGGSKKVAIGGYEIVKILGKGSFGVVRLVREKKIPSDNPGEAGDSVCDTPYYEKSRVRHNPRNVTGNTKVPSRVRLPGVQRQVYAMKVIRKSDMLRNNQEGHLRAERDFLVASEGSRWVVPLVASFQDHSHLYLVMEFMNGGDFLGLLIRKTTLSESDTRRYVAEMILCIEEAHALNWIHRDVKPDNFLISASGHLKISDFGLAFDGHWSHDQNYFNNHRQTLLDKLGIVVTGDEQDIKEDLERQTGAQIAQIYDEPQRVEVQQLPPKGHLKLLEWQEKYGRRKLAKSIVGTSQYMAPEVIRGGYYDGRCDWWSLGIILYECLFGYTPFCCEDRHETKLRILDHRKNLFIPKFPQQNGPSAVVVDLISRLLREYPDRLSSQQYKLNDTQRMFCSSTTSEQQPAFQGQYVYPNDAEDIKAHPFFRKINWDTLHTDKAPSIPHLRHREDTKYFEEDEPISDIDEVSSVDTRSSAERPPAKPQPKSPKKGEKEKKKEKKRPRDRVLRDSKLARYVLGLRKSGAFLGYEYLRIKKP